MAPDNDFTNLTENVRFVLLSGGKITAVDASDYGWLNRWKWHARASSHGGFYAARWGRDDSNKRISIQMGRELLGMERGDRRQADHINGEPLDNRRENLRIATISQNSMNRAPRCRTASGYKGVCWNRKDRQWKASIGVDGKVIYLCQSKDKIICVRAYAEAAKKYHGEFARVIL